MSKKNQSMTSTTRTPSEKQNQVPALEQKSDGGLSHTATMRRISDDVKNAEKTQYPPKVDPEGDGILAVDFDASTPDEGVDNLIAALQACGTIDPDFMFALTEQLVAACPPHHKDRVGWQNGVLAMLHGIAPKNELEGMLAVQMVTCHNMGMEAANRAMFSQQTDEGIKENFNHFNKLTRTFSLQMEALQKLRGQEKNVTVRHVTVAAGAQAVIGDVHQGKSNDEK